MRKQPLVAFVRRSMHLFENELTDREPRNKANRQLADVPDFELNRVALTIGVGAVVAEAGMDRRRGDVNAQARVNASKRLYIIR